MGTSRDRSNISSTSSRVSSMLSKTSFIEYSACIKAQSADPNWANQTEEKLFRLFYITPLGRESNIHGQTNNLNSMAPSYVNHVRNIQSQIPHIDHVINIYPQVLDINISTSSLSYEELQLDNSNS